MAEQENQQQPVDEIDQIVKLKEENRILRENSIPKALYTKALDALANSSSSSSEDNTPTTTELRQEYESRVKRLAGDNNLTNLQTVEDIMYIRDYVLEKEGKDIFLPTMGNITERDRQDAEEVANCYRQAIKYANGDSAMFNQYMGIHQK